MDKRNFIDISLVSTYNLFVIGDESLDSSYNMLSPTSLGQDRMSISELTKKANELNDDKFVPTSVFEELKVRATAAEKKSTHLSSLLSEAESENLRLSQMSTLLKVSYFLPRKKISEQLFLINEDFGRQT